MVKAPIPGGGKNIGEPISFNITIGAGLYEFIQQHAVRAILGKSAQDIAVHLMVQQALTYDREGFLGVKLPTNAFPASESDQSPKGS